MKFVCDIGLTTEPSHLKSGFTKIGLLGNVEICKTTNLPPFVNVIKECPPLKMGANCSSTQGFGV